MIKRPLFAALLSLATGGIAQAAAELSLPQADPAFGGSIAINAKDSKPEWPAPVSAPSGAPNIVLIMTDDTGFGAASTFGGPVETPSLQQLSTQGLRYNNFNTTGLCSPTRAALLTGRNHHRVGFGTVVDIGSGYPGYNGFWKRSTASVARVLQLNGYSTAAFGKWHNTQRRETGPTGPFDRWPTSLGFDYFYGFQGGEQNQYEPPLFRNTTPVDPPHPANAEDYHLTTDIVDDAIGWLHTHQSVAPDKPYFLYLAPGATHAPHHVPKAWVDRYKGRFDQGWDKLREETFARQKKLGVIPASAKLTPRPKELPAWSSLKPEQKKLYARQMEVFAAFLAHTDHEIGRLIDAVHQTPQSDNTLILYIVGDNGASAEGGLEGSENNVASFFMNLPEDLRTQLTHIDELGSVTHDNHYASAWAWGTTTPFQWTKQVASHFGGTRDPLVLSWPARIKDKGGLRQQFTHVNDIAATLYEVTGISFPGAVDGIAQQALDGTSFAYSFDHPEAPSRHRVQYFEMLGNRAIYQDGWIAAARHSLPWENVARNEDFTQDRWELYRLDDDFSEARDLAAQYPDKLRELQALFDQQARANDVYPFNNGIGGKSGPPPQGLTEGRKQFTYFADQPRLPTAAAPPPLLSHRLVARVTLPAKAQGVIVSDGGRYGGYTLYIKDGQLVYENNFADLKRERLIATAPLPTGAAEIAYEFTRDAGQGLVGGKARLLIDGKEVGSTHFERVAPASSLGTFDIGRSHVSPVSDAYQPPFAFNGQIEQLRIELQ
ncbi:arylsulfatase [Solimonas aquatica]|uniref:Arylsulfatase n=1 Tax=Solimonas aquatica TaxID=489703 RepID=A0A1H9I444_9GAMM|nr:arylsulfatase [Solimonas aquatica]SEQ69333.1 arylsulfatase [Solimonas aquatica]